MKKIHTILVLLCSAFLTKAAIIPITVGASAFSPAATNALCGDTIIWVWGQSGTHTTTSTTIPGCATAWNSPISVASLTFAITVPCTGTYNYKCTPHGFTGTITVTGTCSSGISSIDNDFLTSAYPNPFVSKLTLEFQDAEMLILYNMVGEKIKTITLSKGQTKAEINATDLRSGIYFYSVLKEGIVIETKKIVKN